MKCPKCGSTLDTGFNCTKCGYRWQDGVKQPELTTAEMLLLAEMERKEILEPTPSQCVDRWVEMYFEEKHRADVAEEALKILCKNCVECPYVINLAKLPLSTELKNAIQAKHTYVGQNITNSKPKQG